MNSSEGPDESLSVDAFLISLHDDGTSDLGGTFIMNTGEIENLIPQYQATHDEAGPSRRSPEKTTQLDKMEEKVTQTSRASHDTNTGKKRRGPPLNEEEKKKNKKIADQKYRNRRKEERKTMAQQLEDSATKIEQLESALKSTKTIVVRQRLDLYRYQNKFGKMEEELRELRLMNLKAITTRQEQLADLCSNDLVNNHFLMEQEQLRQQEIGRPGFVGHGRPIATSVSGIQPKDTEISQQFEKLKREFEEERINDRAVTKRQMDEVLTEIRALKAIMFEYTKSGDV